MVSTQAVGSSCNCGTLISEHPASRCLDACVAEKVMGHGIFSIGNDDTGLQEAKGDILTRNLAAYSTQIGAAWEVVENLRAQSLMVSVGANVNVGRLVNCEAKGWKPYTVHVHYPLTPEARPDVRDRPTNVWAHAETAPLAICRAALRTTEEK